MLMCLGPRKQEQIIAEFENGKTGVAPSAKDLCLENCQQPRFVEHWYWVIHREGPDLGGGCRKQVYADSAVQSVQPMMISGCSGFCRENCWLH